MLSVIFCLVIFVSNICHICLKEPLTSVINNQPVLSGQLAIPQGWLLKAGFHRWQSQSRSCSRRHKSASDLSEFGVLSRVISSTELESELELEESVWFHFLPIPLMTPMLKPWLHMRFFACTGDAIFKKFVTLPAHGSGYPSDKC